VMRIAGSSCWMLAEVLQLCILGSDKLRILAGFVPKESRFDPCLGLQRVEKLNIVNCLP
jgi:hypothetical protein